MYRTTEGMTKILPNLGKVELINTYGSEDSISAIAGISHESERGPGVRKLLEWGHLSPLEFAHATFKVSAPIFVARQWFRHRTGKYMEKSGRYTAFEVEDFGYVPDSITEEEQRLLFGLHMRTAAYDYHSLIEKGVPKEQARAILPVGVSTKFYFQMDMRNLLNFMKLRLDKAAQYEIRQYAQAMLELLEPEFPMWCEWVKEKLC